MKKIYRRPRAHVCNVSKEMLLDGSNEGDMTSIQGEYKSGIPLKSKSIFDYQDDDM